MTAPDPRVGEDCATCLGCPDCGTTLSKRTPEAIALRLGKVSDGPWTAWDRGIGYEVHGPHGEPINDGCRETFTRGDAEFIAAAPADVAYLLAELRKATRAAQTLGQVIEKQCRDVLDVTGLHHLINEDGDGHWDVVWMRLFEMREELASLKESTIGRERLRGDSWRDRAQEMELSRDAAAAELRDRDEKLAKVEALACAWDRLPVMSLGTTYVTHRIRAAVAAANGGDV